MIRVGRAHWQKWQIETWQVLLWLQMFALVNAFSLSWMSL
jgi:hypothetical protein